MHSHRIIGAAKTADQLVNTAGTLHCRFWIRFGIWIVACRIVLFVVTLDAFVRISEAIIRTTFEVILTLNGNKMEHTIKIKIND